MRQSHVRSLCDTTLHQLHARTEILSFFVAFPLDGGWGSVAKGEQEARAEVRNSVSGERLRDETA